MKKSTLPQLIALLLTIASIVMYFLPYICATEEYKKSMDLIPNTKVYTSADLTIGDMKEMSLFDYAKVYFQARNEIFSNESYGLIYTIVIGAIGAFAVLAFLSACGKKPILLFINSALMGGAFYITNWDFIDRHIMPNSNRVWGIAHETLLPIAIALLVCSIWLLIAKRSDKKVAQ